jgi:hypothetical protein
MTVAFEEALWHVFHHRDAEWRIEDVGIATVPAHVKGADVETENGVVEGVDHVDKDDTAVEEAVWEH